MNSDYPQADVRLSCLPKKQYPTEDMATRVANRLNYDHRDEGLKLQAYGCRHCGAWHIGRTPGSPLVIPPWKR